MKFTVNGEEHITENDTLIQLLRGLEIMPDRVAVEVNLSIVKKADFENFRLKDGDIIEIVNFVGGGNASYRV
ncbi:bifunctional sulfur carrier protein/thiazole synthase protein [bacterium BMS3Abin07]|nr:bifunctional sulfur carrier protein/thiazole synthase protein [bacterium BMS3Abin07]GBE31335.1 bifunctional sulfur carrier protein/thiazole synthase protein [bacterium BMS3Bbin05]HDL20026.1 sulfur carrier protein ThiS [Nitrospirota bacterium]HDO21591.1 sulfur carrier protein ThiS [Nitrospirota bacterium]HDZ88374.1 sulfur carrier protein ThiS [Nitrospirota bacterium]